MMRRFEIGLILAASAAFYFYTLQPSLAWGDGIRLQREAITGESFILAELVTATFADDPFPFARLGVAAWDHPLYVMIGFGTVRLLPFADPLWTVNALSALFGALSLGVFYALCRHHSTSPTSALIATGLLGVSHTFWFHAVTPEVYTLHTFTLLTSLYLFQRYEHTADRRFLWASAFAFGLAAANHLLAFVALPALALYVVTDRQKTITPTLTFNLAAGAALAFAIGFAPYWVQFLRMLRTFALGEVMGPAIGTTFLAGLLADPGGAIQQGLVSYGLFAVLQFGPAGVLAGALGLWKGRRHPLWRKALALYLAYAAFGVLYRVSDQFAFFLTAHVFFALLIFIGLNSQPPEPKYAPRWLIGSLGASVIALPLLYAALPNLIRQAGGNDATFGIPQIGVGVRDGLAYYVNPNKRGDDGAPAFGNDTLEKLPPGSLVIAQWYTDTDEYFVLRYYTAVEGLRPDIELKGYPLEDINAFDPQWVRRDIAEAIERRPVFLASLDERFYDVSSLADVYCLTAQANLYRVLPLGPGGSHACLQPK